MVKYIDKPPFPELQAKVRFRIKFQDTVAMGPGKADVLQGIQDTGSLAETGRRLNMSYQRVWSLVRGMNVDFVEPLVVTQRGGAAGGGATLTEVGQRVLTLYRNIEADADHVVAKKVVPLLALIRRDVDSTG
jgi:molybdate transport system regulatory protein